MKSLRFIFFLSCSIILGVLLNSQNGKIPPLGKLLSPFSGLYQNGIAPQKENQTLDMEGLTTSVDIYFDYMDIPHIFAENEHDLYFAHGYVHARDRLFQMDFLTRHITGRLSEVLGDRALETDRMNRRLGFRKITEQLWQNAQQNETVRTALTAYSEGVNAYISELSPGDYPIEFKLLNYEPELWTPLKSCFAQAFYSNTLSRSEADLENTNALALFGSELFDQMFPEQLGNLSPVIPTSTQWDFEANATEAKVTNVITQTLQTIEKPSPLIGSNNFVVAPERAKNGNVILGNEMDLPLTLPSVWHAAHQHTPELSIFGVTVPGIPIFMVGFNDSIAWGVSNSPRDQVDWYSVQFRDESRNEYRYNNQWFKTEKLIEEISIKGGDIFYDTVIYVHQGPVVYDRNFFGDNEKTNYAMKWVAHQPSQSVAVMQSLNRAKNLNDYLTALEKFSDPPQNILFGSARGDIALVLPGKFPIKPKGMGKFLMDGSLPSNDYTEYIPYDHALRSINPEQGYLYSANQHPTDSLYPYYIYDFHYEKYRNRRIHDRLKVMDDVTPEDFMKLQNDNFSYQAFESLPAMLDSLDTATLSQSAKEYYFNLKNWDYFCEPELVAPTQYELWWSTLYQSIWDEFDTASVALNKPDHHTTIHLLQHTPSFPLFDIQETARVESVKDLYNNAFAKAVKKFNALKEEHAESIKWYYFKNTQIRHILRIPQFSQDHVKIGGGKGIVNAASQKSGPSWRMVVELTEDGPKAWGVYPGGQTGNPGSLRFNEMTDRWANNQYYELVFSHHLKNSEKIDYQLTINPKQ